MNAWIELGNTPDGYHLAIKEALENEGLTNMDEYITRSLNNQTNRRDASSLFEIIEYISSIDGVEWSEDDDEKLLRAYNVLADKYGFGPYLSYACDDASYLGEI